MLINYLLQFVDSLLFYVFSIIPVVSLPASFQILLISMIRYYNGAITTLPYLELPMELLVYSIIPFELSIILMRVFMGNRSPVK